VGALRRHTTAPLDADLASWFDISPQNHDDDAAGPFQVVYVDFGPDVWVSIEVVTQIVRTIHHDFLYFFSWHITVLRQLDLRVVWKLTADLHKAWSTADDGAPWHAFESWEVYFSPLVAHTAVLQRAAFFVTAGGFHHVQEALCVGRPVLGIPFSAEQVPTFIP
ncbi:hypothetical protein AaE_007637, partial [Aphanomyces astaci]